jgi:hypothetical protein
MNFHISRQEFPFLFNIKKDKRQDIVSKIFKLGYEYYFKVDNDTISTNDDIKMKLTTLENSMTKLIGLSNSSMKKGELAENILENIITEKYGDIKYENMAQVDHSGDAWLSIDNVNETIMLESKNYTYKVNKDEIDKMKDDMITNNIKWGIIFSWNSSIQGYRDFDITTFNDNGNTYTIIMIGNLINNMDMIEISIMVIRKLINNFSKLETFPWITGKINSHLDDLNKIISLNYQLTNHFNIMEKSIKSSMDKYYNMMREYQHNIDTNINNIIDEIKGTMNDSIINTNFNYVEYLNKYKKNKKIFILLTKIIDIFQNNNIIINDNNILKNDNIIGNIKILGKKVIITVSKYNANCEFLIDQENKESFTFLDLL